MTLPDQIEALVLEAPKKIVRRTIPMWPLVRYGDDDLVMLRVHACGVCGSDYRYFAGENPWAQHTLGRHVDNLPNIVLGHEYVGTVVAVQSAQNERLLGRRVASICSKVCGKCPECQRGQEHLCARTIHLGHGQGWGAQTYFPGAYAQFVPVWGAGCYPVSEAIPDAEVAMMDILAVAVHVVRRTQLLPGDRALVLGIGPAGNAIRQVLGILGFESDAIDGSETARARALGRVWESLDQVPDGPEYGAVFDSIGTAESLARGLGALRPGGTLVNMAVHEGATPIQGLSLAAERSITTSCNFLPDDFTTALAWLEAGRFNLSGWFTEMPLADGPALFGAPERPGFKIVFVFS